MRDLPFFTTEHGVASLILNQIPYTKSAYIRIQDSSAPEELLSECMVFCKAVGAERVFATGAPCCEKYPKHTDIVKMTASVSAIGDTNAFLFPVTEKTVEKWRELYNQKIVSVPNAAYMTIHKAKQYMKQGSMYFVHRDGKLLGIGFVKDCELCWLSSVCAGAGADIVRALCHAITADTVTLEVATENIKAMQLYEKLGFIATELVSSWYRII